MKQIREFLLRLNLCRGIGYKTKYRLWRVADQYECYDDINELLTHIRLSDREQEALVNNWPSKELDAAVARNQAFPYVTIADDQYPEQLREIFAPPIVLYYQGSLSLLQLPTLAVVGARDMSAYGEAVLRGMLPHIVKRQIVTVSGLAKGIDGMCHLITLEHGGKTIGVIGCGLDQAYPRENAHLQAKVAEAGLVLTEYGRGEPPVAYHFPERNRVIAGLCSTVLVVEAKKKSGSLITANIALEENRTVCAVPGRIDTYRSLGCNELIAAGAKPILRAQDILEEYML